MTIDSQYATDVPSELIERIPPIVDVDAHVVEPADVWTSRLPLRYRDIGPRIEYLPPGKPKLDGRPSSMLCQEPPPSSLRYMPQWLC